MKLIRMDELSITSLKLQGGPNGAWRKSIDEALVEKMVADIKAGDGESIGPVGIDRQKRLWWGHNRYEAYARAGVRRVRCAIYQFKDENEAKAAAIRENLRRKQLSAERIRDLTQELVAITEKRLVSRETSGPESATVVAKTPEAAPPRGGRPKSDHAEAIRLVAKQENVSRQAIEKRLKVGAPDPTPPPANRDADAPPIHTFGVPLSATLLETVTSLQRHNDKAARLCQQLLGELTKMAAVDGGDTDKANELHEAFRRLGAVLRGQRPESLCPYCKHDPRVVTCMACRGRRYATAAQVAGGGDIPKELLQDAPDAWVSVDGKAVPLNGQSRHGR